MKTEAVVARPGFAFSAGQRVFLVRGRVQEDRKLLANRAKATHQQIVRGRTDHDPVAFADRPAQQFIAHRAADQIDFHYVYARLIVFRGHAATAM